MATARKGKTTESDKGTLLQNERGGKGRALIPMGQKESEGGGVLKRSEPPV